MVKVRYNVVWYRIVWYGIELYDLAWFGMGNAHTIGQGIGIV